MKVPKLTYAEIFEAIEAAKSKKDKIAALHLHSHSQLKELLNIVFNDNVKWLVPEGEPPFKKPDSEMDLGPLVYAMRAGFRRLYIFLNIGSYPTLQAGKRQQLFIDYLGSVHPKDAKLLIAIKDKKWPYKSITKVLIKEAFPILTAKWEDKK